MSIPVILAHGSLGSFDELIFLGIGVIFLGMMVLSWLRSRNMPVNESVGQGEAAPEDQQPERFPLD